MSKSKYGIMDDIITVTNFSCSGSYLWRAIARIWNDVQQGIKWSLGNGTQVTFWLDNWIFDDKPLLFHATGLISPNLLECSVADFVNSDGNWKWDVFSHLLPHKIILHIAACKPPCLDDGIDQVYWKYSKNGNFTVSSAYSLLANSIHKSEEKKWSIFWKWNGPHRIRMFLWLAFKDKLLTNAE